MNSRYEMLAEMEEMWAGMLIEMLKNNGIACISSPVYGAGFAMSTGMQDKWKVYVENTKLEQAKELYQAFFVENFQEE